MRGSVEWAMLYQGDNIAHGNAITLVLAHRPVVINRPAKKLKVGGGMILKDGIKMMTRVGPREDGS